MNIILVNKKAGGARNLELGSKTLAFIALSILLVLPLTAFLSGLQLADRVLPTTPANAPVASLHTQLNEQYTEILGAKQQAEEQLKTLTAEVGRIQAHLIRLNALGDRLTSMTNLDEDEFSFGQEPAQGGPAEDMVAVGTPEFLSTLEVLASQVAQRREQLEVLENVLMKRELNSEIQPLGKPTQGGWISSFYGMRKDPFTGRRAMHKGMDIAGKSGQEIFSTGAGVITWAGKRYGYGLLVEVDHGNGYVTRYGHNKKIMVKVGDKVEINQVISLMGSSGRSTGPHVHYEILRNGAQIDPKAFVYAQR